MRERPDDGGGSLRGARDASVAVGASEFIDLLAGWPELEAMGEITGALLLVRVGDEVAASTVVPALAALDQPLDVVGPVDPLVAGALVDVAPIWMNGLAANVHADMRARFEDPVWVATARVRAPSGVPALDRARQALDAGLGHDGGAVVELDGTIVLP